MAVLLGILKVIGIVLLVILCIILVLLLIILLCPIGYRIRGVKHEEEIHASGNVWWLLHAVHVRGSFDKENDKTGKDLDVRLFGIPILKLLEKKKQKAEARVEEPSEAEIPTRMAASPEADDSSQEKTKKKDKTQKKEKPKPAGRKKDGSAKRKPTAEPGRWKYNPDPDRAEGREKIKINVYHRKEPGFWEKLGARIASIKAKISKTVRKLSEILDTISDWLDYLATESFDRLRELIFRQLFGILRHILPRKIEGEVEFGLEDPSVTGKILAGICTVYPVLPPKLSITPDFAEQKLEADVDARGHIVLGVLVAKALRILISRDFRVLLKRIKKMKNKE